MVEQESCFLFVGIPWSVCSDPFALPVPFPFSNFEAAMSWELKATGLASYCDSEGVTSEKVGEVPGLLDSVLVEKYDERARVGTSDPAQIPVRASGSCHCAVYRYLGPCRAAQGACASPSWADGLNSNGCDAHPGHPKPEKTTWKHADR